jgi:hypothetical protein
VAKSNKGIVLSSATKGASIGYQIDDQIGGNRWMLYNEPIKLKVGQKMVARAKRIGYKTSQPVIYLNVNKN